MEPVTINLEGLSEFGPLGYILGHLAAGMFFGAIAWRNIACAGSCYDNSQTYRGNTHIARSVASGVLSLASLIILFVMSGQLFYQAVQKSSQTASAPHSAHLADFAPNLGPYIITTVDDQFAISTLKSLSDRDIRMLKILGTETNRIDEVVRLSNFLKRCKARGIQVTTISPLFPSGALPHKAIYNNEPGAHQSLGANPGNESVEITLLGDRTGRNQGTE